MTEMFGEAWPPMSVLDLAHDDDDDSPPSLYPTTNKKSRVQSMRLFCGLISQFLRKPSPAVHGLVNV